MLKAARSALVDADVLIYLTEIGEKPDPENAFIQKVAKTKVPVLLVINKIDLSNQEKVEAHMEALESGSPFSRNDPHQCPEKF